MFNLETSWDAKETTLSFCVTATGLCVVKCARASCVGVSSLTFNAFIPLMKRNHTENATHSRSFVHCYLFHFNFVAFYFSQIVVYCFARLANIPRKFPVHHWENVSIIYLQLNSSNFPVFSSEVNLIDCNRFAEIS